VTFATIAYDASRSDDVLDLLERVYGERPDPRELDWWFDGNPVGPRALFLAEDDAGVIGVLGASFYRALVHGDETRVALPLWAATDPRARGRGVFQKLNAELERTVRDAGAPLQLGFTNRMAGPIYVAKLGWVDVARPRLWARIVAPVGRRIRGKRDRFAASHERAYALVAPQMRNHFVRSREYLDWRYATAPREYTTIDAKSGFAVVGTKRRGKLVVAFVADLVAPNTREAISLLRACVRKARGAHVMLALVPSPYRAAFAAVGFTPTPKTIRLIGKSLDGRAIPNDWDFTLGDTDYF
jgi:GNAT superfamily N-acetyltransferase